MSRSECNSLIAKICQSHHKNTTLNDANKTSRICTGIYNLYKKLRFSKCIGMYFFFKLFSSSFNL